MVAVSRCKTLLELATLWSMQAQYHTILAEVVAAAAATAAAAAAIAVNAAVDSAEAVTAAAATITNEPSHRYTIMLQV
jgi:hypothetical protein